MNEDFEEAVARCSTCMESQQTQPKNIISHQTIGKPWEIANIDIFMLNIGRFRRIVDFHSKFPVVERAKGLLAKQLKKVLQICTIMVAMQNNTRFRE